MDINDHKHLIELNEKMNLSCNLEQCNKYIVPNSEKKIIADEIHTLIHNDKTIESYQLITLFAKIINPEYIKKQLLEFELDNITCDNIENKDMKSNVLNILSRYHSHLFDDIEWNIEENKKNIKFKNTCLHVYVHDTKMYVKKIIRLLRLLYPKNDISYYFKSPIKHCARHVFEISIRL